MAEDEPAPYVPFDPSEDEAYQRRKKAFDEALKGYTPTEFIGNTQCWGCGRITGGPAKEPHWATPRYPMPRRGAGMDVPTEEQDKLLAHVSREGKAYTQAEAREAGLAGNISHTRCPECAIHEYQTLIPLEQAEGKMKDLSEQSRSRSMERVEEAYQPVPEAYEPVAEAYEPVPISSPSQEVPEQAEGE